MSSSPASVPRTLSKLEEYECWYCTPEGDVDGVIEVLDRNRVVLFTPFDPASSFQCVIFVGDAFELGVVSGPPSDDDEVVTYFQVQIKPDHYNGRFDEIRNVYFRFGSREVAVGLCRRLLSLKWELEQQSLVNVSPKHIAEGVTQIPYFSDHINITPIPSPETKPIKPLIQTKGLVDEHSAWSSPSVTWSPLPSQGPGGSLSPSNGTPPPVTTDVHDRAADAFTGTYLLTPDAALTLREFLPLEHRFCEMRLLFTPKIHGTSVPQFYRHTEYLPYPSVMIVRDAKNCCSFGALCVARWAISSKYFGSSENMVFTLRRGNKPHIEVHACGVASNTLLQFCDDKRIVIGGGRRGAAICIFENWLRGTSHACETFGTHTSLCCTSEFVVGDIEFWALVPESFQAGRPLAEHDSIYRGQSAGGT